MNANRQEIINGYRAMLDFLEANPGFELSLSTTHRNYVPAGGASGVTPFVEQVRMLGDFEKGVGGFEDEDFCCRRSFGPVTLEVYTKRTNLCTPREVTKTVTVTEYDCPDSLLELEQAVGATA